ncbi:MAG: hypothetical protein AAGA77_10480 [Bacteroidota bacterium]
MAHSFDYKQSINPYNGEVNTPLSIAHRNGRNGLDLDFDIYYSSNNWNNARTWNLDAPTSVVGLGWDTGYDTILADSRNTGNWSNDIYWFVGKAMATQLVCSGTTSDNGFSFLALDYKFWKITFYPPQEKWVIIKENGDTYIFGDKESNRNTIALEVVWNNWYGPSTETSNQVNRGIEWKLNSVSNRFGDQLTFSYTEVQHKVGSTSGKEYTQVLYLDRIESPIGEVLQFIYEDKSSDEYQIPHTDQAPPNAYQDRYNTKLLKQVQVIAKDGSVIVTNEMTYTPMGEGNLTKPLLTSIKSTYPNGKNLPTLDLKYWGQDPADGVSATKVYDSTTKALYGALKQATMPLGGTVAYAYTSIEANYSSRDLQVRQPEATDITFDQPKFYFHNNIALCTWLGSNNEVTVQAFTWTGRWLQQNYDAIPVANAAAYASLQIELSNNLFALYNGDRLYTWYISAAQANEWIRPKETAQNLPYFNPGYGAESINMAVGDNFVGLLGTSSGKLNRYQCDGLSWTAESEVTLNGNPNTIYALTGKDNYLFAAAHPNDNRLTIYLYEKFITGNWQSNSQTRISGLSRADTLELFPGDTFVVVQASKTIAGTTTVSLSADVWERDFSTFTTIHWGSNGYPSLSDAPVPILSENMVVIGQIARRYFGKNWDVKDLSTISYDHQVSVEATHVSWDKIVRLIKIDNAGAISYVYDMVEFNPNNRQWRVPTGMMITNQNATLAIAAPRTSMINSNYVILANKVWYKMPNGTWEDKFTLPDSITAADLPSIQLIGSEYLVYQVNGNTKLFNLRNGNIVNQTAVELEGEQIYDPQAQNILVGLNSFVGYTGTYGANSTFKLHTVMNELASGKQTLYAIESVSLNSGYATTLTGYQYDRNTTTVDVDGSQLRFNKCTSIPAALTVEAATNGYVESYFFNGLNDTEINYPIDPNSTNAAAFYSQVLGLMYKEETYNKGFGDPSGTVNGTTINYINVSQILIGQLAAAYYSRILKFENTRDKVLVSVEQQYSTDTGLMTKNTKTSYNSEEIEQQLIEEIKYWWEVYDPTRAMNLLMPTIEVKKSVKDVAANTEEVISTLITTWKDSWNIGNDKWAPDRYYTALNANPSTFNSWNPTDPEPGPDWLKTGTVTTIESKGWTTVTLDVEGRPKSSILDKDQIVQVVEAVNVNLGIQELSYLGFEPYERLNGWTYNSGNIENHIISTDYYTGTRCLQMNPGSGTIVGPMQVFTIEEQNRNYIFGCWAKLENGFVSTVGKEAGFEIIFYKKSDNSEITAATLRIDFSTAIGKWEYFQQLIDLEIARTAGGLPSSEELYFKIQGYNKNDTKNAYVDNLRFSPVDCIFNAMIYDPVDYKTTGLINNNGQAIQTIFNGFNQKVASIGPEDKVNDITTHTYSRNLFNENLFQAKFPNSNLILGTSSTSQYYDFHDGDLSDWLFSDPDDWAIVDGELAYDSSKTTGIGSTAELTKYVSTNFAARVDVRQADQATKANVAMGNGFYFVRWNEGNTSWELGEFSSGTFTVKGTYSEIGFREEWLFAVVDGFILFYADGIQLFSYKYNYPNPMPENYGKLTLALTEKGSFDNLILLQEPQIKLNFFNGLGNHFQSVSLQGKNIEGVFAGNYTGAASGVFFDDNGRVEYSRETLSAVITLSTSVDLADDAEIGPTLVEGDQDSYLYNQGGQHETKEEFLTADKLNFTTNQYEPSPIPRVLSTILPRLKTADASHYTKSFTYSGSISASTSTPPSGNNPAKYSVKKQEWVQKVDDGGAMTKIENTIISSISGHVTQVIQGEVGGVAVQMGYSYNNQGLLSQIRQPNYFTPPSGSEATSWVETMEYTYRGMLKKKSTPDTGINQFIYNDANRLRFVLDADGASHPVQRIIYFKYDALGRMIESGYIQDSLYQWGADGAVLQAKANESSFPITDPTQSGNPNYASGAWHKRWKYDIDKDNPNAKYMLGKIWKVEINNKDVTDYETYAHDAQGNRIKVTSLINHYSNIETFTFLYGYNNQNQIASIQYPLLVGNKNFSVGYYYDRLGKLASIGQVVPEGSVVDPSNPPSDPEKVYAEYLYDFYGRLEESLINNGIDPANQKAIKRMIAYNTEGLVTDIIDNIPGKDSNPDIPFFTQRLYYNEATSPNETKYFDGSISADKFIYADANGLWEKTEKPEGYINQFQYDPQRRITQDNNSLSDYWSMITPGSYDANGNMLSAKRGENTRTFGYKETDGKRVNNQLDTYTNQASIAMNFENAAPGSDHDGDWKWGGSNNGPSATGILESGGHRGTGKCLKIAGGSLTHYCHLLYQNFLDANGSYSTSCWIKTEAGFDNELGSAAWYAILYSAQGKVAEVRVQAITEAANWTEVSFTIDLNQLLLNSDTVPISFISLELRNYKRGINGSSGPYLLVDDISITGDFTTSSNQYNENGLATKIPTRNVYEIEYNSVSLIPQSIQKSSAEGNKITYDFNANEQTSLEQLIDHNSNVYYKKLQLSALSTHPLFEKKVVGTNEETLVYIHGIDGILAFGNGSDWKYPLVDRKGSPRLILDDNRQVVESMDYLAFGQRFRQQGSSKLNYLYAGFEYNNQVNLYDSFNNLYDAEIGRYMGGQMSDDFHNPYVYVQNEPLKLIDQERFAKPNIIKDDSYLSAKTANPDGTDESIDDIWDNPEIRSLSRTGYGSPYNDFIRHKTTKEISIRLTSHKEICKILGKKIYRLYKSKAVSERVMAVDICTNTLMELPEDTYIFTWRKKDNSIYAHSGQARVWQDLAHQYDLNPQTDLKHSQVAERDDVWSSGKFEYLNGRIHWIDNSSGHYRPGNHSIKHAVDKLSTLNIDSQRIQIRPEVDIPDAIKNIWKSDEANRFCYKTSCFRDWLIINEESGKYSYTERVYANLTWLGRGRRR